MKTGQLLQPDFRKEVAPFEDAKSYFYIRAMPHNILREVEDFKMKVKEDPDLEYIKDSPLLQKMINEGVTWKELFEIEKQLKELKIKVTK